MDFPPSSILKKALQNSFKSPVTFKNSLTSWVHVPSTNEQLLTQYGDVLLNFRLVSKLNKGKMPFYIHTMLSNIISNSFVYKILTLYLNFCSYPL